MEAHEEVQFFLFIYFDIPKQFFSILTKLLFYFQAVVRFGSVSAPLERGEVVPGTYCSRNFYECYRKRCRLQSPNYPGMYPRNVTCYLSLRQKEVPTCKHAMIVVRQENSHKMQIKVSSRRDEITFSFSIFTDGRAHFRLSIMCRRPFLFV